jgi:GntR family transcriptional repressor for pyruvate dehydrogenase complex
MNLRRDNLSQLVLENIEASIRDGQFKPGSMLPSEKEMSDMYSVGKSSVREAIKMLQVLGVVESIQGRGTYLRESIGPQILKPVLYDMMLQRSNAEELYEFRLMFDIAYISIAIRKATECEKQSAREKFYEYRELCRLHDPEADRVDLEFHRVILDATKNQFIIKIGNLIMELCHSYMRKGNAIFDETVMENHEKLMEMFCSGDLNGLPEVVMNSLVVFRNFIYTDFNKNP